MNTKQHTRISAELHLDEKKVSAVHALLADGATVPFIARYRKEVTGDLNEVVITTIRDRIAQLEELDKRKESVLKSLQENGHLTDELKAQVQTAETLAVLEDIYLPFRPKRRTRATMAREKGLEPLALAIFNQNGADPEAEAEGYLDSEKQVETIDDALAGARDIIAEWINEDSTARETLRSLFTEKGKCSSRVIAGKEESGSKYRDYFDWEEPVGKVPSHRMLAMRRGEKEEILDLSISPPADMAVGLLHELFVFGDGPDSDQVALAAADAYKRLLSRSMETETRLETKNQADKEAIRVFADNLQELLLAPPLGNKRIMGVDPGFRTGCKVVCLDRQGKLLCHETVYLHLTEKQDIAAAEKLKILCQRFSVEAVAVGNGTAGRETMAFFKKLLIDDPITVVMVNESGASIYSASETAREEFPDLDLTVRGSISIGRRLMDPLAELVKIDPKSIGVGQYQHDVDQTQLKKSLDDTVVSCVNRVGVDVNRASSQLLAYVSGLGKQLARNILTFRNENGPFPSRRALKKVPRLGPKAYEQAAGFLRIPNGETPLDASAVHPESYHIVDAMARDTDTTVAELLSRPELRKKIDIHRYISDTVGEPTLKDIVDELARPGRDPRKKFEEFTFAEGVEKLEDLTPGMKLPGIVTNVTAFGAFVDIGVHQDGLVHISELADKFVRNPADVVKVHQKVMVRVLDVDLPRKRISLSMKSAAKGVVTKKKTDFRKKTPKKRTPPKENKQQQRPFNNPFAGLANLPLEEKRK